MLVLKTYRHQSLVSRRGSPRKCVEGLDPAVSHTLMVASVRELCFPARAKHGDPELGYNVLQVCQRICPTASMRSPASLGRSHGISRRSSPRFPSDMTTGLDDPRLRVEVDLGGAVSGAPSVSDSSPSTISELV